MTDVDSIPEPAPLGAPSLRSWSAWRDLLLRAGVGLLTIFAGVTAAFFFDGYREQLEQEQQLRETRAGVITELKHYESRGGAIADDIDKSIARWKAASASGVRAVPAYYLMNGSSRPPTAAWTSATASGVASRFDPDTQLELGYFYSEYLGIHENYVRRLVFTEQEILPKLISGPSAFYDTSGKLQPEFMVHMNMLARFSADLRRLNGEATRLRVKLEAQAGEQGGVTHD
jgi:hypothetical protein